MSSHNKEVPSNTPPGSVQVGEVVVLFNPSILKRFKQTYADAVASKADLLVFDGNEYVPAYAKYLIEYLDNHFKGVTS